MSINSNNGGYRLEGNSDFADALDKALKESKNREDGKDKKQKKKKQNSFPKKIVRKIEKDRTMVNEKKGSDFTTDDIMRTLNQTDQWQGVVKAIFDDGINLFVGNKNYFIPKVYFDNGVTKDLKIGDSVAFELGGNRILTLIKNIKEKRSKIENINKNKLKDGIHKGVVSHYQDKDENHSDRGYYIKIGKVGGEQDELFLPLKDMKTSGIAKVGDLISLKIKDTKNITEVEEFYLKPGDEFILSSNNYKYINKKGQNPFIFVDMGVYKGIIRGEMLPKGFKKGDSLDAKVRFVNKEKSESARDGLRGKWLVFEDVKKYPIEKNKKIENNIKYEKVNNKKLTNKRKIKPNSKAVV